MGPGTRTFAAVLQSANSILQKTFGMELVELRPMPSDKDMNEKDAELLKNTGVKKKSEWLTPIWLAARRSPDRPPYSRTHWDEELHSPLMP